MRGKPIENGMLVFNQGRVIEVSKQPSVDAIDLGDVCVLPPLVNSHTHLEFSDLSQPIAIEGTFPDWISRVVAFRRHQKESMSESAWIDARAEAIRKGLQESVAAGVGSLVDMVTQPWKSQWVHDGLRSSTTADSMLVTCLAEMMGFDATKREQSIEFANVLERDFHKLGPMEQRSTDGELLSVQAGLSPHAPYTMSIDFLSDCAQRCIDRSWLLSMHVAESMEEMEWLANRSGPFRELLDRLAPSFSLSEPRYQLRDLISILRRAPRSLLVHGNYLDDDAIESLTRNGHPIAVVYCPRTHAAFGHREHPWRTLKKKGIPVLLGTDSRASNPDLSILEEARFLVSMNRDASPEEVMSMITVDAARFFGQEKLVGSIEVGSFAPTCMIACHTNHGDGVFDEVLGNGQPLQACPRFPRSS